MNMNYHRLIYASLHYHRCIYENILNIYQSLSGIQEPAAALSVVANANPFSMEKARACTFQVSRFSKLPSKVWNSMNLLYLFCGLKNQRHPTTTDSQFSRNPFHFLWTGSELYKSFTNKPQKYRDFSRVSYYILPIYRVLFRLQVLNSIFVCYPHRGAAHLATYVEGVQCGWFGVSQIPGMDESWKIRTAVNTHIAGWKIHLMLMLFTRQKWGFSHGELLVYRKVKFREYTHISGESRIRSKKVWIVFLRSGEMVVYQCYKSEKNPSLGYRGKYWRLSFQTLPWSFPPCSKVSLAMLPLCKYRAAAHKACMQMKCHQIQIDSTVCLKYVIMRLYPCMYLTFKNHHTKANPAPSLVTAAMSLPPLDTIQGNNGCWLKMIQAPMLKPLRQVWDPTFSGSGSIV